MTVTVNGEARTLPAGATVADLVRFMGHDPSLPGVAVALDGEVLRRVEWSDRVLRGAERLEVLTAVQGG